MPPAALLPAGAAPPAPATLAASEGFEAPPEASRTSAEPGGAARRYHIIVGDTCPVCRGAARISFPRERPPQIPVAGCREPGGCRCSLPIFAEELAAALATLDVLESETVHKHLWHLGTRLQEGVRAAIRHAGLGDWIVCGGAAPWTIVNVREPAFAGTALPAKTLIQQEMLKRGVLYNGSNFVCSAHTEDDIDEAIAAYGQAFARLAQALPDDVDALLEAAPVSQIFRMIAR